MADHPAPPEQLDSAGARMDSMTSNLTSADPAESGPSPSSTNQAREASRQAGRNDDVPQKGPTMMREETGGGKLRPGFSFLASGSTGLLTRETLQPSGKGSPESKGPFEIKETSKPDESRATMMELLLSPSSGGDLQARLENVELDPGSGQMKPWQPGQRGGDSDVLLVVQRRGRPEDETTGRRQRVFVTVVPDEVSSSTGRGSGLGGLRLRSVVNFHVGPREPSRAADTIAEAAKRVVSNMASVLPAKDTIAEAAKRVVSDMESVLPWSVRQKRGTGVYVYSMLASPGGLSKKQDQAVIDSVVRNLQHRGMEVVNTLDQDKPPVLLLLCHLPVAEGTTPRSTLLQLGLPLTHSANTILALVQEGQTEDRERPKIVGFDPGLKALLTVEPLSYQLEKCDNNGKALHEIERFSRPPFFLWKYFPIQRGVSWQKM